MFLRVLSSDPCGSFPTPPNPTSSFPCPPLIITSTLTIYSRSYLFQIIPLRMPKNVDSTITQISTKVTIRPIMYQKRINHCETLRAIKQAHIPVRPFSSRSYLSCVLPFSCPQYWNQLRLERPSFRPLYPCISHLIYAHLLPASSAPGV